MNEIYISLGDETFKLPIVEKDGYVFLKDIVSFIATEEGKPISVSKFQSMLKELFEEDIPLKVSVEDYVIKILPSLPYIKGLSIDKEYAYTTLKYSLYFSYYILKSITFEKFTEVKETLEREFKPILENMEDIMGKAPDAVDLQDGELVEVRKLENGLTLYAKIISEKK